MSKIAFLFSGQGAQHPGMGMDFYQADEEVRRVFDAAENLRPGTLEQLKNADAETLKKTENTQPCLYLADLAAALYLQNRGVQAACAAGFSLGELPALAFAGAFSYDEGFRLVCERARLMGLESSKHDTGMAALLKLSNEAVEELCGRFENLYPVNYNAPGQVAVAGDKASLASLTEAAKAAGGLALPLKVSGGFHSPFMSPAAADFAAFLETAETAVPALPVYANRTASIYTEPPAKSLAAQIDHPVLWEKTIRAMAEEGVDTFIETGVGVTLQKLVMKILPGARVFAVETPEQAETVIKELESC